MRFYKTLTLASLLSMSAMAATANCTVTIPFASGSAAISAQSQAFLRSLAANNPTNAYQMTGHTDNVGSAASNARLSNARLSAVQSLLLGNGVQAGAIQSAQALGETGAQVSGASVANRRVEIRVSNCVLPTGTPTTPAPTTAGLGGTGAIGGVSILGGLLAIAAISSSSGT